MPSLINKTTNEIIVTSVNKSFKLIERMRGLLGEKDMPKDSALWISPCRSIHTFFMQFPIDALFVDKNLRVVSCFDSIPSGRIIFGGKTSHSVFEMKSNKLKNHKLNKGDQLYVGH